MNNSVFGKTMENIRKHKDIKLVTTVYEFWYDYIKPKYGNDVKLCYMDTDSFIMNIKTNDFYEDITNDVKNRFDTSNYEVNRPFPLKV